MALFSLRAQIYVTGSLERATYIELYQYPWLPVSPGKILCRRHHQYTRNLLSINLSLPQKLADSSCDVNRLAMTLR